MFISYRVLVLYGEISRRYSRERKGLYRLSVLVGGKTKINAHLFVYIYILDFNSISTEKTEV